jgi:DNA-binding NtrC family response regulator
MPSRRPDRPRAAEPQGTRLLIVEDEPGLRQMLSWGFEELGYRVEAVASYRDALWALGRGDYQYALLDYRLADGTGQDLLALLAELQPAVRAVLMSGELSEPRRREACLIGARAALAKPVSVHQIDRLFRA